MFNIFSTSVILSNYNGYVSPRYSIIAGCLDTIIGVYLTIHSKIAFFGELLNTFNITLLNDDRLSYSIVSMFNFISTFVSFKYFSLLGVAPEIF